MRDTGAGQRSGITHLAVELFPAGVRDTGAGAAAEQTQREERVVFMRRRGNSRVHRLGRGLGTLLCAVLLLCQMTGCGGAPEDRRLSSAGMSASGGTDAEGVWESRTEPASGPGEGSESQTEPASVPGEESESPAEPASPPKITLVMVGDILLHNPVAESAEMGDGGYDFTPVFANMREEIQEADLALVNQEVIIGGTELGISGYPSFNAPYELGDALSDAGFDVILHATNHALDKGKRGLVNCMAFWEENYPGIAVLGIHESREDQQEIYVYEQDGIRIAVLNYTYGTNGIPLPQDMPYGVDLLEEDRVVSDLHRAEELADFVVVCPHWGTEYRLEETEAQQRWARLFADNGADLVLGTHPHVIEPVEWVDDTLVYYSLGNFVNWTSGTGQGVADRMVGGMAQVTVGLDEEGRAVITDYGVEPLVCHLEVGFGGVTVYPLEEYTEELAKRNEIVGQDGSFSLDYCRELSESVFGETAR